MIKMTAEIDKNLAQPRSKNCSIKVSYPEITEESDIDVKIRAQRGFSMVAF